MTTRSHSKAFIPPKIKIKFRYPMFKVISSTNNTIILWGDGVADRTKVSVATRTVAGSNPGHGWHFSGGHGVWRERPASPTRAWQIPTGAHLKILPN